MARAEDTARASAAITRLALIRQGKRQTKATTMPGLGLPVKLAVLSCSDVQECYAAAFTRFADLKLEVTPYTLEPFNDELATQVLARALLDAEQPYDAQGLPRPVAETPADLRDNTTVDERAAAFQEYRDFQHEVDPSPAELSSQQLADIVELVKKKDGTGLMALGSPLLVSFILTTASRPQS